MSGAERMQRSRARRRKGLRLLPIEVRDSEIEMFVSVGRLTEGERNSPTAIRGAIYGILEDFVVARRPIVPARKLPNSVP
jgi:hypothetical protein